MKTIFIVDDDTAIRDAATMILEHEGYKVVGFEDASPLLHAEVEPPALVILDKQLPGVDGFDVCAQLKMRAETQAIPVIILSASPQLERRITSIGANAFLEKPFRMKRLRELVHELIG